MGSARINAKKGEKKEVKRWKKKGSRQRAKPCTPTSAIDALIGEEEQTGGERREKKERNRERVSNPPTLDPSVSSYDPQGSYGEPIL